MKKFTVLSALVMLSAMLLAACGGGAAECTDDLGCVEVAEGEPIRIAYMLTTSGATAFLGDDSIGGIQIAVADQGQLLGHDIELVGEDSGCSAEGGQTAAQAVAADTSIVGVIGTNCSSAATAALQTISDAGLVMLSPSNTAPALTDDDEANGGTWKPGYFRTAHNDLFQGRIAAEFAYNELGARSVATIHDGSPYADQLQQVMSTTFTELGGTVTSQQAVNVGDTDMNAVLTAVASDSPDILYFPIFEPEGNFIAAQSQDVPGLENTLLMGSDGLLTASFAPDTGAAANGMYLSGPFVQGVEYESFLEKWEDQIGGVPPSGFHAFAYDATNILLQAIEDVAVESSDGSLSIGRQALRDAIAATASFDGLTGTLSCTPTGDCATGEALAVFELTQTEIDGSFPPDAIWAP